MIHGYRTLNHPLAQIRAAQEFCAQVDSYISDVWEEERSDKPPPCLKRITEHNVINVLAKSGLRFEAGMSEAEKEDDLDAYFSFKYFGRPIDRILYRLAVKFVKLLHEELDIVPEVSPDLMWRIVVRYACSWEDLIFVLDDDGVVPRAQTMFLDSEFFELEDDVDDDDENDEDDKEEDEDDDEKEKIESSTSN